MAEGGGSNPEYPKKKFINELSPLKSLSDLISRTLTLLRVSLTRRRAGGWGGRGGIIGGLVIALRVTPVFSAVGLFLFSPKN